MAAAAAAAANEPRSDGGDIDPVAVDAIDAVHAAIPGESPPRAEESSAEVGDNGAVCSAIVAGVAAAVAGWDYEATQKLSKEAFERFRTNEGERPDAVAGRVAKAVSGVSSRFLAEAAAAAAHAAYLSMNAVGGVADGAVSVAADGSIDDAANSATTDARDDAAITAVDGAVEDAAPAATVSSGGGVAVGAAGRALVAGAANAAAAGNMASDAAIAAALAAGEGAEGNVSPGHISYGAAATPAARRAIFGGARMHIVGAADAATATSTRAQELASIGVGAQQLEEFQNVHKRAYEGLQTLITLDTFLAGFLLTSLTGKREEEVLSTREVTQIILQTASFVVLLTATVYAGTLMLATGGKYLLSKRDLVATMGLSMVGLGLVLLTVGNSTYLALGLSDDDSNTWFYVCVFLGLFAPVYAGIIAVYIAISNLERSQHTWSQCLPCTSVRNQRP